VIIGIPREIKSEERRVSANPDGVKVFVRHGHQVMVELKAGLGCGISDDANVINGKLTNQAVAEALGLDYCNI